MAGERVLFMLKVALSVRQCDIQSRTLIREKQYPFAVVLAQAACELATEEALTNLMIRRGAPFRGDVAISLLGRGVACTGSWLMTSRVATVTQRATRRLGGAPESKAESCCGMASLTQVGTSRSARLPPVGNPPSGTFSTWLRR